MGLGRIEHIVHRLMEHGAPGVRPAAIVTHGTSPRQRVLQADLATLADAASKANLASPALLVVGDVAALGPELSWFAPEALAEVHKSA